MRPPSPRMHRLQITHRVRISPAPGVRQGEAEYATAGVTLRCSVQQGDIDPETFQHRPGSEARWVTYISKPAADEAGWSPATATAGDLWTWNGVGYRATSGAIPQRHDADGVPQSWAIPIERRS